MNGSITVNAEEFGFILSNWTAISIIMYSITFITVIFAIVEKTKVWHKILNVLIITFVPIVGCLVYLLMRRYKNVIGNRVKGKLERSTADK